MKFINDNNLYESWAKTVFRTTDIVTNAIGRGFRSVRLEIIKALTAKGIFKLSKDANILVMNDFDLTVTKILCEYGYTNISLLVVDNSENKCLTSFIFNIKYKDKSFKKLFPDGLSFWKNIFYVQAKEVSDIGKRGPKKTTHTEYIIEGVNDLKFDLIIANPPYGKPGANITKKIIDEVDFKEFINLLPANDYKRNDTKDLYNYQSDMEPIIDGFGDAAVTTHLAKIYKTKVNNISLDEFERSQYIDPQLDKYFEENSKRSHYAIDSSTASAPKNIDFDSSLSIMFNHRTAANKHLAYSKDTAPYSINNNIFTYAQAAQTYGLKNDKSKRLFDAGFIHFNSLIEKQNIVSFMYSTTGFKFISKALSATNTDSWLDIDKFLPKVDWTRSWTVEEILKEYSYTEEEIAEVMADLDNFKGMND